MSDEIAARTPREIADEARTTALATIEETHNSYKEPGDIAPAEQAALDAFADAMATALLDGLRGSDTAAYVAPIADAAKYYNKTDVQGRVQDAVEERENVGKTPLDDMLRHDLRNVRVIKTTDKKQGTVYRWDFPNGEVETRSGKDGRGHFAWHNFRDLYLEATGDDAGKPAKGLQDGEAWRDFTVEIIEEKGTTVEHTGPRTLAVESLRNHIRNQTAYPTDEHMIVRDGVGVVVPTVADDLPEWWANFARPETDPEVPPTVEEIHVPAGVVKRIADRQEVTTRGVQTELDARGYTLDRLGHGVSENAHFNGNTHPYWALSPKLAVPRVYDPHPESAAEQTEQAQIEATPAAQAAADGGDSTMPEESTTTDSSDDDNDDSGTGFTSVGGGV